MANERNEKLEGHEEEEYHFSDDQATYEVEADTTKPAEPATVDNRQAMIEKVKKYRRPLIGIVVFFVLMFIVYKMLSPATIPTEPDQNQVITRVPKAVVATPAPTPPPTLATAPANGNGIPAMSAPSASAPSQPSSPPPLSAAPSMGVEQKLAMLEQQNAKLMNLLQTQYAQRMSDYENQNTALQNKLQELTNRITSIENSITQLTQGAAQQSTSLPTKPPAQVSQQVTTINLPPPKPIEPRMSYSVQAIIPGRAWLKSDAGDTVTVAEGDVLKDYGRIAKIDPYDGIVEIDTGSKTITLTYGTSGD